MEKSSRRDSTVDLLRGISILLVLIHHFHLTYRIDQTPLTALIPASFLKRLGGNGNYGVVIFFVISGYLITKTTQARHGALKNLTLKSFYTNRVARIVPNIALMVTLVATLAWAGLQIFQNNPGTVAMSQTLLSIATFTHNVQMQHHGWFNYCLNTLWSLSVEEVFYFGFPLLCLTLKSQKLLIGASTAFVITGPLYRARHLDNDIVALHAYLSCFDAIAMGCIAAVIAAKKPPKLSTTPRRLILTAAATTIVAVYFYKGIFANAVYGISLTALATAVILVAKPNASSVTTNPTLKLIQWFGKNSYELYLFHIVILALMRTAVPKEALNDYTKPLWFAIFMTASAVTAELISKHYAEPLNRALRSYKPSLQPPCEANSN